MRDRLQRLIATVRPGTPANLADVQLRLLVAMAYADGVLGDLEADQLAGFVDRTARSRRDHERMLAQLDEYAAAPPHMEDVLHELVEFADERAMGARLVDELAAVAGSDHAIDHREEFLLDLVCDTFGLAPVALADDDEDPADVLYDLVHRLARAA